MYSWNGTPGTRPTGSTFTSLPADPTQGDDRLAQVILKFDTAALGIPTGLGAANYHPQRLVLTAMIESAGVPYDPTEDARNTYNPGATVADSDAGRPFELHGTGFRGGFTAATFQENSAFGLVTPGGRNAYALGFTPQGVARDVSRNVTQNFDSAPWAVGKVFQRQTLGGPWIELQPGATINGYEETVDDFPMARFEVNLDLPGVRDYVCESLNRGFIWLTLSSLHASTQQAAEGYPNFILRDHPEAPLFEVEPTLDVTYSLPLRISSFTRTDGSSQIQWNASPGYSYVVETSADLKQGSWQKLTTTPLTTATPGTLSYSAPGTAGRAFFRIVRTKP